MKGRIIPGPKESNFHLVQIPDARSLKEVLTKSMGIKVVVKKKREIYYIDNVKFHIDEVEGLGILPRLRPAIFMQIFQEELQNSVIFI